MAFYRKRSAPLNVQGDFDKIPHRIDEVLNVAFRLRREKTAYHKLGGGSASSSVKVWSRGFVAAVVALLPEISRSEFRVKVFSTGKTSGC